MTGVPAGIDVNKQPKNFRDAMSREDRQEWAEAYDSEYQGFLEHGTLKMVRLEQGDKKLGTTTRTEYKVTNWVFKKRKMRLCVMGNQQKEGVHYQLGELYALVMKAAEVRQFVAIVALLNGDIGEVKIYVCAPDWRPEHVPHGCALQPMKSMYGTRQAARQWHMVVSFNRFY